MNRTEISLSDDEEHSASVIPLIIELSHTNINEDSSVMIVENYLVPDEASEPCQVKEHTMASAEELPRRILSSGETKQMREESMPPEEVEEVQGAVAAEWIHNRRASKLKRKLLPMDIG